MRDGIIMKIGILTLPLNTNYGGILQCYALQSILRRMGHEVIILQRTFSQPKYSISTVWYYCKQLLKLAAGKPYCFKLYVSDEQNKIISQNIRPFIEKNIVPISRKCSNTKELKNEIADMSLDAIVVGSDQVWRVRYSPCISDYYLGFLPGTNKIKRISYAASFGTDIWEYSLCQTINCGKYLRLFDSISVREKSGVELCKKYFNMQAELVLDPTLLLNTKDYDSLLGECDESDRQSRGLFCYMLDRTEDKMNFAKKLADCHRMFVFETMPELETTPNNVDNDIKKCIYPSIEEWLSSFRKASMVVTDSFHGTVFSIIFNKPFWVIGNTGRGLSRFESLLSLFGLQNRLLQSLDTKTNNMADEIDWEYVNKMRLSLSERSLSYLRKALIH